MNECVNTIHRTNDENPDDNSLRSIQEKDSDIALIINWLETDRKPKQHEISGKSIFLRTLLTQWDLSIVSDNLLCRK